MKKEASMQTGSAVIIVLAFLVLITVLAVGLMDTIRTEHVSANTHLGGVQAEFYAQVAVDRVVGTLQKQTASQQTGTSTVYNWISQPGQLVVGGTANSGRLSEPVPLYSGTVSASIVTDSRTYFRPANLNAATFRKPSTHFIAPHVSDAGYPPEMYMAWIYVRKDGTLDSSETPILTDTNNPIVGRYAYWTDDESSKVNMNLAWGRNGNPQPAGDPSMVDLTALRPLITGETDSTRQAMTQTWADLVHGGIAAPRFYNSPNDIRRIADGNEALAKVLENYKFETTHYNADPDLNCFGEPRIVLTTQLANVPVTASGGAALPFIDILKTSNADPGDPANIDDGKLSAVLSKLIASGTGYLTRTDWPMAPGSSFQKKYFNSTSNQVYLFALNIIEYVRCKESPLSVVPPLRGDISSSGVWTSAPSGGAFLGTTRAPRITELGVVTGSSSKIVVKTEVFSPPNFNLPDIDLSKYKIYTYVDGKSEGSFINAGELSQTTLKSGTYVTITHTYKGEGEITQATGSTGASAKIRMVLIDDADHRLDFVPFNTSVQVPVDGASVEVNDPLVNRHSNDWKACSNGTDTFGRQNSRYLQAETGTVSPQQDTDSTGVLTDINLYMPPPKGSIGKYGSITVDNTLGLVRSVGELGFIHTGLLGSLKAGVPWRSVRLQPTTASSTIVPDWALLDLFTVPVQVSDNLKTIYQPNKNSYGGRVNMHSRVQPFGWDRILPLAAVFQGARKNLSGTVSASDAQKIARNIADQKMVSVSGSYGFSGGYYSPGQIVEVTDVADSGEESEELVRQVINMLTVRGNVFTIYSVGEAVKQTPNNKLVVLGQRRLQSMVERYVDPETSEVRFRTIYYRNLTQ